MSLLRALEWRRAGRCRPIVVRRNTQHRRTDSLALDTLELVRSSSSGVTCLDIAHANDRYLLAGSADSSICLFDVDAADDSAAGAAPRQVSPVLELRRVAHARTSARGHANSISAVQWYPVDTGIFMTAAMDGFVKIWDTQTGKVADAFEFKGKSTCVYAAAMSTAATQHSLVAVGTADTHVSLCDIVSGNQLHQLSGHRDSVLAVAWHPRDEYLVASAGRDCSVRLWDIRRSGVTACVCCLDMRRTRASKSCRGNGASAPLKPLSSRHCAAHVGPVTALSFAPDGQHLVSSAQGGQVRLWDTTTASNTLVHFDGTRNCHRKGTKIAVAQPGAAQKAVLFHPSGSSGEIRAYRMLQGTAIGTLKGHLAQVNCVVFRESTQQLFSGADDGMVLCWAAPETARSSQQQTGGADCDADAWSSDGGEFDAFR